MKILLLHNRYKIAGGEDSVFNSEVKMLRDNGNIVDHIVWDNSEITTLRQKVKIALFSLYNPFTKEVIERKIKEFNPDMIHIHNFFPQISPSVFFVADKFSVPVVMTLHNFRLICSNAILYTKGSICEKCVNKVFPLEGIRNRCYRNSYFQTLNVTLMTSFHKLIGTWRKRVGRFIVLTDFQKEKIGNSSLNLKSENLAVKPNFVSDPGVGLNQRENFFIFVGRLSVEKGINVLLDSFKYHSYKLKIIGDGAMKELVLKESKSNPNIEFLGYKGKDFLLDQIKRSRALIFPSESYEGFPIVITEALATGTPVISSNIGSQAEIVGNGYNGIHFKVSDPKDLAEKIKLFDNKEMKKMYINSRKTYLEKYTPEINYKILKEIYKKTIDEKKKNNFN